MTIEQVKDETAGLFTTTYLQLILIPELMMVIWTLNVFLKILIFFL